MISKAGAEGDHSGEWVPSREDRPNWDSEVANPDIGYTERRERRNLYIYKYKLCGLQTWPRAKSGMKEPFIYLSVCK